MSPCPLKKNFPKESLKLLVTEIHTVKIPHFCTMFSFTENNPQLLCQPSATKYPKNFPDNRCCKSSLRVMLYFKHQITKKNTSTILNSP